MFHIISSDDIDQAHDAIEALEKDSNLPSFEFARVLMNEAERIVREEAKLREEAKRPFYEPDFVSLADKIAGVVENTNPRQQCR